jgi:hypothetical protein
MLHGRNLLMQDDGPSCLDGTTNNFSVGPSCQHGAADGVRRGGPEAAPVLKSSSNHKSQDKEIVLIDIFRT